MSTAQPITTDGAGAASLLDRARARLGGFGARLRGTTGPGRIGHIGIDIARDEAHAVQFERSGGGLVTLASVTAPLRRPRDELLGDRQAMKRTVRRLFAEQPFRGRTCVSTLPNEHFRTLSVSYQVRQGADPQQALLQALGERLAGDPSQYVVDCIPVRTRQEDNQRVAVAVVAQQSAVLDYLEALERAGLRVAALEIGASAIRRLVCSLTAESQRRNVLLVNFGTFKSYLSIISGRRLLIDQEVELGELHCVDDISRALGIDGPEARATVERHGLAGPDDVALTLQDILKPRLQDFVAHLRRLLMFARSETRGEPVDQVYLAGSIARWSGAADVLDGLVAEPVSLIPDPIGRLHDLSSDLAAAPRAQLAVASGLAMRGLEGSA